MKGVLTIQGQMVKIPLQSPGRLGIFPVLSLFFHLSLPKISQAHPIKILFSKLTITDLLLHKVWGFQVKNCGFRKHLKLGDCFMAFLLEIAKKHLVAEWLSWLPCKRDFINSTILET